MIRRAITSVLDQTYIDLELVVVDDASTDGTAAVVESFLGDPRVSLVRSKANLGPAGARNLGVRESSGEVVAFQDSDDRWLPEKLEVLLARTRDLTDCVAVYSGALYYSEEECYYIPRTGARQIPCAQLLHELLSGNLITPQALMLSRRVFDALGGFDDSLEINEDWDLALRLSQLGTVSFVPDPLLVIYRTPGSVSTNGLANAAFRERMIERYHDLFDEHPVALAHQHYITGRLLLEAGAARRARHHLRRTLLRPTSRSVGRWIESELRVLLNDHGSIGADREQTQLPHRRTTRSPDPGAHAATSS